jgi:hypothetical protein
MFPVPHLLSLAIAAVVIFLVCRATTHMAWQSVDRFLKVCAILVLFFDPVYWIWEFLHFGTLDFSTTLPLYFCSLFWILLPVAVFARNDWLRQTAAATVCTIGLLGGIVGLVLNIHLAQYPFFHFVPIRSMLYHFLMVLVTAVMWTSGYYRPRYGDSYRCLIPIAALVTVSLLLHQLFGWDYCYTAGGIGTPLERLSAVLPNGVFLLFLYGSLALLIQLLFYRRYFPFPTANWALAPVESPNQPDCAY